MTDPLFDRWPLSELAESGQVIECKVKIENLERLGNCIAAELEKRPGHSHMQQWRQAAVDIKLRFNGLQGDKRLVLATGSAVTSVAAVCQRCLGDLDLELVANLQLLLISGQSEFDIDSGYSEYELWELEDDRVRPIDLVDESLVMRLPLAPLHATEEHCGGSGESASDIAEDKVRPFADLRAQLARHRD